MFPSLNIAAGACSGNGIVFDISDPLNPTRMDEVVDEGFAYWHSATFNNAGTKVIFTDEWGGGGRPRCLASDPLTWGADAIFDIVDGRPESEDVLVWQTARFEDYKYAARREPVGLVWSPMDKAELASRGYPEPTVQGGRTCFPKV